MKERRTLLLKKLWKLKIPQELNGENFHLIFPFKRNIRRRCSFNSIDSNIEGIKNEISKGTFTYYNDTSIEHIEESTASEFSQSSQQTLSTRKYVMESPERDPEKYTKFIKSIISVYEKINNSSRLLEELCNQTLRLYNANSQLDKGSINKTFFMSKLIKYH